MYSSFSSDHTASFEPPKSSTKLASPNNEQQNNNCSENKSDEFDQLLDPPQKEIEISSSPHHNFPHAAVDKESNPNTDEGGSTSQAASLNIRESLVQQPTAFPKSDDGTGGFKGSDSTPDSGSLNIPNEFCPTKEFISLAQLEMVHDSADDNLVCRASSSSGKFVVYFVF